MLQCIDIQTAANAYSEAIIFKCVHNVTLVFYAETQPVRLVSQFLPLLHPWFYSAHTPDTNNTC